MGTEHDQLGEDEAPLDPGPNRRTFLTGAGATALAGLVAACSSSEPAETATSVEPDPTVSSASDPQPTVAAEPTAAEPTAPESAAAIEPVAFDTDRQEAVVQAPAASGIVAAFDVMGTDRASLVETFQVLSQEMRRLMGGGATPPSEDFLPPSDSGALGPESSTSGTAMTLAVGASLFDERFGLADRRPRELIAMPLFFNDRLVRDDISHGDLAVTITAPDQQTAVFALHQLVRASANRLQLRWVQEGYNQMLDPAPEQVAPTRNLMGFRDGTSNLDTTDPDEMDQWVWVQPDDGEPDWAVGGSYLAVRTIRMLIEFWATAALVRQEQIFGRHRATGAPLGQATEGETPAFADDPTDEGVPSRSHIRLANPRQPGTGRILRRGFSYLNGVDASGTLDQGLLFLCFQRSMTRGFLEVQSRLDGEPLEDYIKPVGGGFFFILPGPGTSGDGWLGQQLLR